MKKVERALKDMSCLTDILKLKVSTRKKEKLLKKAYKEWVLKYITNTSWKFKLDFHLMCVRELCKILRKQYSKQ